jgi:hypothetical protein
MGDIHTNVLVTSLKIYGLIIPHKGVRLSHLFLKTHYVILTGDKI